MASKTAATWNKRNAKKVKAGKKRKAKLRNAGSTKSKKTLFGD